MNKITDNYYELEGNKRLKSLEVNPENVPWKNNQVLCYNSIMNKEYWDEVRITSNEKVELNKIIGTYHSDYFNKSWLEMLGCLKRIDSSTLNREHVLKVLEEKRMDISLHKFGESYFISGGNHRVCMSKFLGNKTLLIETVYHHQFNNRRFEIDEMLKKRKIEVVYNDGNKLTLQMGEIIVKTSYNYAKEFIDFFDKIQVTKWDKLRNKLNFEGEVSFRHFEYNSKQSIEIVKSIKHYKLNLLY